MSSRGWKTAMLCFIAMTACSESRQLDNECATCEARVHPPGIQDPGSADFHGVELARRNWSFATCASCHGEDFTGGASGVSCVDCHAEGPTECSTCHQDGPTTGAHVRHRDAQLACNECHRVPDRWDAPGHIVDDAAPAEVTFGATAALTPPDGERAAPPAYQQGTCSNVYCHGGTMARAGGSMLEPAWMVTPGGLACSSCHAAPPPSHARGDCATCHPATAPHVDGVVQIGTAAGCSGCHGDATSSAPPRDLTGATVTTVVGVGAHRTHLDAPSGLRGPIACSECHAVPATVSAPGHLDSAGPAEVVLALGWDRTSDSCATAWCHGNSTPQWTRVGEVACGTCHGIPPATAAHTANMPLTSCATCHPQSVTATGAIIISGATSAHINGVVDAL